MQTFFQQLLYAVFSFCAALLARIIFHINEVRKNKRSFWSKHLFYELPIALCMGFVADGVNVYFGLEGQPAVAVIVVLSYLGPRGTEVLAQRFFTKAVEK